MTNNSQAKVIFRENSIKRFHSPEDLHSTLKVITPTAWCWILFSIFLMSGIFIWAFYGRLVMTVAAYGIIIPAEYLLAAEKTANEIISERQSRLTIIKKLLDARRDLYKKHYLTLTDIERAEQEYISAKYDLMNTTRNINPHILKPIFINETNSDSNTDHYALLFVKNTEGKKIAASMDVQILPTILSVYEFGYIKGKVINISKYPISKEIAYTYLGNMNLVEEYFITGSPYLVTVKLDKNANSHSGFAWTSHYKNSPLVIDSGTTVTAKIIHNVSTPFKLFINSAKL